MSLWRHDDDASVQTASARALSNLAKYSAAFPGLSAAQCVPLILAAMRKFPGALEMHAAGTFALCHLVPYSHAVEPMVELDAVVPLIGVVKRHAALLPVVRSACAVLSVLTETSRGAYEFEDHFGMVAVFKGMAAHMADEQVLQYGTDALRNCKTIVHAGEKFDAAVSEAGGVPWLISLAQAFPTNVILVRNATFLLHQYLEIGWNAVMTVHRNCTIVAACQCCYLPWKPTLPMKRCKKTGSPPCGD